MYDDRTASPSLSPEDESFLEESFQEAEKAYAANEVPVGCVLVYKGEVIGRGHNDVNRTKNPTRHAEMVAVEEAEEWCHRNSKNVSEVMFETTLYVTLEPCIMCAAAMYQLHIRRMVFGACNERFGGVQSVSNASKYGVDYETEVAPEVAKQRSIELLRRFYARENPFAPEDKKRQKSTSAAHAQNDGASTSS
ncbi:tRNA-specific adenosine deaminase 2 [Aphelenchoides avenae]|nr:tRNA-specific adenosine deaminase 2 [Aphelenchus avenae]